MRECGENTWDVSAIDMWVLWDVTPGLMSVKNWFYSENMFGVVFELEGLRRVTVKVVDSERDVGGLQVKDIRERLDRSQIIINRVATASSWCFF